LIFKYGIGQALGLTFCFDTTSLPWL
jgi:hypothetical protein